MPDAVFEKRVDELVAAGMSRERAELAAAHDLGLSDGDIIENNGDDNAVHAEDQ